MRSSGTAYFLQMVVALLLVPSASGSPPQAGAAGNERPHADRPSSTLSKTPLVLLDVAVSGARNLKAEDLTILEDGQVQKLVFFELHQPASAASSTPNGKPQRPELGANVFTNAGWAEHMGTRNVIVIDPEESSARTEEGVRKQLIEYVRRMPINDPLAIFRYTPNGVRMMQDFTTDRKLLEQGIAGSGPKFRRRVADPASLPSEYFTASSARWKAQDQTLKDFMTTLAAYPGRKNLIWLAETPALGYDLLADNPRFKNPFRVPYMFPMIESLAATLFETWPLVPGKISSTAVQAGSGGGSAPALMDSDFALYLIEPPPCRHWTPTADGFSDCDDDRDDDSDRDEMSPEFHHAMNNLAKRAGGKAYHGRHYLTHVIRESMNAGSTYYVLGYYPENTNRDGSLRHVEVKLSRHGDKLRYRCSYIATMPGEYAATTAYVKRRDLERALDLATPQASSIVFYAQVTLPSPQTQNKVAVQYAVNSENLEFQRSDDGLEHASIECAVEAYTEEGYRITASSNIYEGSLKPDVFRQVSAVGFPCMQTLGLPAGNYVLRLAVRDNRTGSIGTADVAITVPPATGKTPAADPSAVNPKEGQF